MGGEEDGDALLPGEAQELLQQLLPGHGIQTAGGLIQQQELRPVGQGQGQGKLHLHAR